MKSNYWYVSRANEIFIDTDNYQRSRAHTFARLLGAIECERLDVLDIEMHHSNSRNHVHTLITLREELPAIERYIWALILHSDIYRTASNVMRELNRVAAADVFITPTPFSARIYDDKCGCEEKHGAKVMQECPAAIRLRGENRVRGFFGKPNNEPLPMPEVIERLKQRGVTVLLVEGV